MVSWLTVVSVAVLAIGFVHWIRRHLFVHDPIDELIARNRAHPFPGMDTYDPELQRAALLRLQPSNSERETPR